MSNNHFVKVTLLLATVATTILLAACAPMDSSADSTAKKDSTEPAIAVDWTLDSECATCHTVEQETYEDSTCLAYKHQNATCISCHANETSLTSAHEGATSADKMPQKLKKSNVSEESCLSCHYGTKEELATATPDILITDEKGNMRNPHDSGAVAEHQNITCSSCHAMHKNEDSMTQAKKTCQSCHHTGVFECYTCHE